MQQHIKSPQIIPYPIPSQFWLHQFSPTTFQKLLISKHCRSTNGTLHDKERDSLLPVFVNITDGKCGGNRGALDIPVSPHSVVIADRGYCDFSLLDDWDNRNVFFVVRHRDNLHSQIDERLLPETRAQNVLIDEIIEPTGEQTKKKYTKPLRRIAIWNDEHGYVVQLLTNNFKLSAPTIA